MQSAQILNAFKDPECAKWFVSSFLKASVKQQPVDKSEQGIYVLGNCVKFASYCQIKVANARFNEDLLQGSTQRFACKKLCLTCFQRKKGPFSSYLTLVLHYLRSRKSNASQLAFFCQNEKTDFVL